MSLEPCPQQTCFYRQRGQWIFPRVENLKTADKLRLAKLDTNGKPQLLGICYCRSQTTVWRFTTSSVGRASLYNPRDSLLIRLRLHELYFALSARMEMIWGMQPTDINPCCQTNVKMSDVSPTVPGSQGLPQSNAPCCISVTSLPPTPFGPVWRPQPASA
jgi:hypothetical protein